MPQSDSTAQALLPLLLDNLQDYAIFMMDTEGIIVSWTPGVLRILGYEESEFVGRPASMIFTAEDCANGAPEREMQGAIKWGQSEDIRWHCRKDGTLFWANGQMLALRDEKGQLRGLAKILRDETRRKAYETHLQENDEALRQARDAAQENNRLKDEFLATLSHELRTPLNAILGWANMLRTNDLDRATLERGLETIERNARAQSQLINDLMDVSRILTGKLRLELHQVELSDALEQALATTAPALAAKDIELETDIDRSTGLISGDSERIAQIFWNLLSNAVKFTPRHGRLHVTMHRVDSSVQVRIQDSGKGIEPEFLPYVFERFRQADSSSTRSHGGLGIGLGLVRYLTEAHGGSVGAASEGEGKGSTFTVTFPLSAVRAETIEGESGLEVRHNSEVYTPAEEEMTLPPLSDLRILVVDDEADSREMVGLVLKKRGATIEVASDANSAYQSILQNLRDGTPYDVLVSDVGMPEESGIGLIRRLRSFEESENGFLPAIALTAYAGKKDRIEALLAGFQVHVAKPVEPLELVATVASLVGRTGH